MVILTSNKLVMRYTVTIEDFLLHKRNDGRVIRELNCCCHVSVYNQYGYLLSFLCVFSNINPYKFGSDLDFVSSPIRYNLCNPIGFDLDRSDLS